MDLRPMVVNKAMALLQAVLNSAVDRVRDPVALEVIAPRPTMDPVECVVVQNSVVNRV